MRFIRLESSLSSFRTVSFEVGFNLLLADKSATGMHQTRNGTGKSSLVRLLRWVMGADPVEELKSPSLADVRFSLSAWTPELDVTELVVINRVVGSPTVVVVKSDGESVSYGQEEWRRLVAERIYHLGPDTLRPTLPQLRSQSIRTSFDPVKMHPSEPEWESGARIGFLLGLDPASFAGGAQIAKWKTQQKALNSAAKEGLFSVLAMDAAELQGVLASARLRKGRIERQLKSFQVDAQYQEHQIRAGHLSQQIRVLNDRAVSLESRIASLRAALQEADAEIAAVDGEGLASMYREAGVLLPELVQKRFHHVAIFHESVIRNRKLHLEGEVSEAERELAKVQDERSRLDQSRATTLRLLEASMALESHEALIGELTEVNSMISDSERKLETLEELGSLSDHIKIAQVEARQRVQAALAEGAEMVDFARTRFVELAEEIYGPTEEGSMPRAALKLGTSPQSGHLRVEPVIRSDGSTGIKSVLACLLDYTLMETATAAGRWPGYLVHDSELFDGVDSEQVAACLSIGHRIADETGCQYIVTLNSDVLASVERESSADHGFSDFVIQPRLGDSNDSDRLFGCQLADWKGA